MSVPELSISDGAIAGVPTAPGNYDVVISVSDNGAPAQQVSAANSNGEVAGRELFDPTTKTFTPAGNMGTGRHSHTATVLADVGSLSSADSTLGTR